MFGSVGGRTGRVAAYAILVILGVAWAATDLHGKRLVPTDWLAFESAARSFIHFHHEPVYAGNRLGLYARLPAIQVGPPAWLPLTALQWVSPWPLNIAFVMVMVVLGVASIAAVEAIARQVLPGVSDRRRLLTTLVVGAGVMIVWSYNVAQWHHLDDAMALSFTAFACLLIQRRRAWWLVGLLVGTAIAARPWALMLAPVLIGLPRGRRSPAAMLTVAVAAAWWAPFVLGASGTFHALSTFPVPVSPGTAWWLIGVHGDVYRWLRPVQFVGGIALGVWVAKRPGNAWLAAPLAAIALRVLTDPYPATYYSMGPVLFALAWDLIRPGRLTKLPVYSAATLLVEGVLAYVPTVITGASFHSWVVALEWGKLVWGLAVIVAIVAETRTPPPHEAPAAALEVEPSPAPAPG